MQSWSLGLGTPHAELVGVTKRDTYRTSLELRLSLTLMTDIATACCIAVLVFLPAVMIIMALKGAGGRSGKGGEGLLPQGTGKEAWAQEARVRGQGGPTDVMVRALLRARTELGIDLRDDPEGLATKVAELPRAHVTVKCVAVTVDGMPAIVEAFKTSFGSQWLAQGGAVSNPPTWDAWPTLGAPIFPKMERGEGRYVVLMSPGEGDYDESLNGASVVIQLVHRGGAGSNGSYGNVFLAFVGATRPPYTSNMDVQSTAARATRRAPGERPVSPAPSGRESRSPVAKRVPAKHAYDLSICSPIRVAFSSGQGGQGGQDGATTALAGREGWILRKYPASKKGAPKPSRQKLTV